MLTLALEKLSILDQRYHSLRLVRIVIIALAFGYIVGGYSLVSYYNVQRFAVEGFTAWNIATPWDDLIPLIPAFVFPYQLYIPLMVGPALLPVSLRRFIELGMMYCLTCLIGWFFHFILPVKIDHAELLCQGLSCDALRFLRAIDPGVNILPSLHVAHSLLALAFVWRERHPVLPIVLLLALSVIAATVLIKQHYLIDLPAGVLTAVAVWWLVKQLSAKYLHSLVD